MNTAESRVPERATFIDIIFSRIGLFRLSLFVVLYLIILGALTLPLFSNRVTLREGETAAWNILSPITSEVETQTDKEATEQQRRQKEETVNTVYFIDKTILEATKTKVQSFFGKVRQLRTLRSKAQKDALRSSLEFNISIPSLYLLTSADPDRLELLESVILKTLYEIYIGGVEDVNLPQIRAQVQEGFRGIQLGTEFKNAAEELIIAALSPNKKVNTLEIQKMQTIARESVPPQKTKVQRGLPIVLRGEKITKEHIALFKALGMYGRGLDISHFLAQALFEFILLMLFFLYLYFYRRVVYNDPKKMVLISMVSVLMVLLARFLSHWNGHAIPVPAAAMLLVLLVDGPVAIIATLMLSVLVGLIYNLDVSILLMQLAGGYAAIASSLSISQRADLTRAGFFTAFINMVTVALIAFLKKNTGGTEFWPDIFWGGVNGVASAVFVIGTLPYWEALFNVVTPIRLAEMANPNQPLLRRLLIEAPGTYHHSLMVANMAEAAAEVCGADPLLSRVGGYYHDIGKIRRPDFFVENQVAGENPHDRISPRLSTIIILSHPRDGVELAEQYNVPDVVRDIIAQHHGTGVVSFFFRRSQSLEQEQVNETEFRYENLTPRTREAAIVMLADSVEAAVRSLEHPTPHKIETLIRKIFKERLDDGQLSECPLTLKDLARIREAFLHVLSGRFHQRIGYTEKVPLEKQEEEQRSGPTFDAVGD
jgi:putative nucleotidyltransferase with HDIG domain